MHMFCSVSHFPSVSLRCTYFDGCRHCIFILHFFFLPVIGRCWWIYLVLFRFIVRFCMLMCFFSFFCFVDFLLAWFSSSSPVHNRLPWRYVSVCSFIFFSVQFPSAISLIAVRDVVSTARSVPPIFARVYKRGKVLDICLVRVFCPFARSSSVLKNHAHNYGISSELFKQNIFFLFFFLQCFFMHFTHFSKNQCSMTEHNEGNT